MRWVLSVLLVFVVGSGACRAQSTNAGDIRGSVTDTSGGLIPGVKVTVLNVDTGVSKEFTTNSSGLYDTNSIIPGHYKITFAAEGFDLLVRGPITLEVGFTTVNGQLKVGSTKEQVTVTSDVPLLTTETGDQSTVLDAKSMDELPQVTQSWENFVILLPGAVGAASSAQGSSNPGQQASINGNLPYSNILSDGASTTLGQSMNANATTFEDVAELQVNTSSFSAQYGIGGVIFNQITKSGTSSYHGTGYDFFQNNALNAAPYSFGTGLVPALHYNNFGGALGGPVAKLKKMFFYFNYDHIIDNGAASVNLYTIPTADMLTGDFSSIAGTTTLYDPTTQTIAHDAKGTAYPIRQSFLSENGSNTLPALDTVAAKFAQLYPTPAHHIAEGKFVTPSGTGAHGEPIDNFASDISTPNPTTRYFGRLDYDVTSKHRLTMTDVETDNPALRNPSGVTECPVGCQSTDVENNNAQITDVWTISPRIVNEVRLGYTYQYNNFASASRGANYPQNLGWQFAKQNDFPDIDFEDGDWSLAWINKQVTYFYKEHVLDPSDVMTFIAGRHILHFGGEFLAYRNDSTVYQAANQSGSFSYGGINYCGCHEDYTAHWSVGSDGVASIDPATPTNQNGWAFADFLLGYAASWSASVQPEYGSRLKSPQLFIQDDFKIRPNLTINLGIRYQINHGWSEVHGDVDSFDPRVMNPATNTLGAMWFGSTKANGRSALEANVFNTVLPRVGFSWLLSSKTTVRGGFGMYAYNWSTDDYGVGLGSAFGSTGSAADGTGGVTPITKLDGTGTNFVTGAPLPYIAASTAPDAYNGQNVNYTAYHTPVPRILQWNLAVQREVAPNLVVELSYVASHAFDLIFGPVALNQIPQSQLLPNTTNWAAVPYPNYSSATANGSITGFTNNATSNYNSLQAQITRRYASGVSFNFNYVWSHMLDSMDSSGWGSHAGPLDYQNSYSPSANYGASNFDTRNAFKGNVVYQLPFGKGKRYLSHSTALDEALGGWQVSGTITLSTGNPFTVTGDQNTHANGGGSYPNWSGLSPKPAHRNITTWYNPEAFQKPADGTFGNVRRNVLYGPGLNVVNLSAHKEFALVEAWHHDVKLQIRADASNAFNHASFGEPNGDLTNASGVGTNYTGTSGGGRQINSVTVGGRAVQLGARVTF
jgi:hypothetical protein